MVKPSQRREVAEIAHKTRGISIQLACSTFSISDGCYYYGCDNALIADWLVKMTSQWLWFMFFVFA